MYSSFFFLASEYLGPPDLYPASVFVLVYPRLYTLTLEEERFRELEGGQLELLSTRCMPGPGSGVIIIDQEGLTVLALREAA